MATPNSRKRPAPGAAPILPVAPAQQNGYNVQPPDQMLRWPGGIDPSAFNDLPRNANAFMMGAAPSQYIQQQQQLLPQQTVPQKPQQQALTSTTIARRPPNRALVPSVPHPSFDATTDTWANFEDANGSPAGPNENENESIEVLEERAQRVKKEAQAKRKPIPPFVQKLSSFLEEQKNTDLIRWSESGDSFIVLDEDEFAKTLIPELFKHNNYASFVRQLNMYGFHKRVGLSDNSMKASERKNKSPSEYSNPYFKRGHPNLLWLINKPKSGSKSKKGKKDDGDGDSEEDIVVDEPPAFGMPGATNHQPARPYGAGSSELGPLQKKDFQVIKDELSTLQNRQAQISKVMQRLVADNAQLQSQARMFQTMHERHENSINAILNFLANVFRKSLEEQGGVQSVTDLIASILPNGQMPQGSVVDVSDDFDPRQTPIATAMNTPAKRQRLLPPIPAHASVSSASTGGRASSAVSPTPSADAPAYHNGVLPGQMGSVTELFDSPGDLSTNFLQHELQSNPHEGMLKIIHDTNANTPNSSVGIDLPEVAASTPISLSDDQRNRVLSIMSTGMSSAAAAPTVPAMASSAAGGAAASLLSDQFSMPAPARGISSSASPVAIPAHVVPNAMPATTMADSGAGFDLMSDGFGGLVGGESGSGAGMTSAAAAAAAATSLSPILSHIPVAPAPAPPSLHDIANTQSEIEALQRLQDEQNAKISDLSHMLGPLSPSGRVPGIDEDGSIVGAGGAGAGGAAGGQSPGYFDFLDPTAYGDDFNFATGDLTGGLASAGTHAGAAGLQGVVDGLPALDDDDFNFGFMVKPDEPAGRRSPSTVATEEIPRTDMGMDESAKRRRVS